jgi:hypothetical protein
VIMTDWEWEPLCCLAANFGLKSSSK